MLAFVFVPRTVNRGSEPAGDGARTVVVASSPAVERVLTLVTERTVDKGPVLLLLLAVFFVAAPLLRRRPTWASTAADVGHPRTGADHRSPLRRGPPLLSV
ncbi:MAG TPA: hypothetical protein VGH94_13940 [Acidimicrobiales bacterium]